jgi:predicted hydrocarbon binding protein
MVVSMLDFRRMKQTEGGFMVAQGNYDGGVLIALMKVMATLNAQEDILGRGVLAIMYQNGRDVGLSEGKKLDRADTLASALTIIRSSSWGQVWNIELWRDQGQSEDTFEEDGKRCAWLVWRDCPVRQVCLTEGAKQDGAMCRISYGLFAGILSSVMGTKVDIVPVAQGPNACKKKVIWRC